MPEERERGHTRFKVRGKTCIFRSRWTRSSPWFLYLRENSSSTSKESKREKSLRPKGGKKGRPIESCIKMERTSQALRPDADEVGMACDAESGRASARRMWRGEARRVREGCSEATGTLCPRCPPVNRWHPRRGSSHRKPNDVRSRTYVEGRSSFPSILQCELLYAAWLALPRNNLAAMLQYHP